MAVTSRKLLEVALGLAVAAIMSACGSDSTGPGQTLTPPPSGTLTGSPEPAQRLGYSFFSGYSAPARLVVADVNALEDAWIEINQHITMVPSIPDVDFTQDLVVVAAMGSRSSGGFRITIDSARAAGQDVDVFVTTRSPATGCVTAAVQTSPVDVVSLARPAGAVVFVEDSARIGC
ncbi:MAG: protease complex subunit PrcB family protein [Gemmatimonadota bacterium]